MILCGEVCKKIALVGVISGSCTVKRVALKERGVDYWDFCVEIGVEQDL